MPCLYFLLARSFRACSAVSCKLRFSNLHNFSSRAPVSRRHLSSLSFNVGISLLRHSSCSRFSVDSSCTGPSTKDEIAKCVVLSRTCLQKILRTRKMLCRLLEGNQCGLLHTCYYQTAGMICYFQPYFINIICYAPSDLSIHYYHT